MNVLFRDVIGADKNSLVSLIEDLQDHMIPLDPLKRVRRMPGYTENTYNQMLDYVRDYQGKCMVAEIEGEIVGFIAGLIAKQSEENLLSVIPTKLGVVKELFVVQSHRKENIGKQLIEQLENYFKQSGCDSIWIEVFAPNEKAHEFYKHLGYHDREISMLKKI